MKLSVEASSRSVSLEYSKPRVKLVKLVRHCRLPRAEFLGLKQAYRMGVGQAWSLLLNPWVYSLRTTTTLESSNALGNSESLALSRDWVFLT